MDSSPMIIRTAQTLGITLSTLWAGATLTMSIFTVPGLLMAPVPIALKQWTALYNLGKVMGPPISLIAAGAYGYLAYQLPSSSSRDFTGYVTAAVLSAVITPYTIVLMMSTNNKLLAKEVETRGWKGGDVGIEKGESTSELLRVWGRLNFWRGVFLMASGVIGAWTALA